MTHKRSFMWRQARVLSLTENMSFRGTDTESVEFKTFVDVVGDGSANILDNGMRSHQILIPDILLLPIPTMPSLCDFVFVEFPDILDHSLESVGEYIRGRGIMCSTNDQVHEVNAIMHHRTPCHEFTYLSTDAQVEDPTRRMGTVQVHHLNRFTPQGTPTHVLKLKIGTPVMLLRNHSPRAGHCNGTKYVVVAFYDNLIKIKTITGPAAGEVLPLHRFKFFTSMQETEIEFSRIQFPIRPCFGLTVHKAQGQSLQKVGISLMKECFTHGQLYVALSRSTTASGLRIIRPLNESGDVEYRTQNIVWDEILN